MTGGMTYAAILEKGLLRPLEQAHFRAFVSPAKGSKKQKRPFTLTISTAVKGGTANIKNRSMLQVNMNN